MPYWGNMQYKSSFRIFSKQIYFVMLMVVMYGQSTYGEETGKIVIRVLGLKSSNGSVRFGLFNSEESFPKPNKIIRKGAHTITNGQCEFVIEGVSPGEYAVAVGHDKNGNGKIDRFLGYPLEPVGVSGYSKRLWAKPSFKKAKFPIGDQMKIIEIPIF